MFLSCLVPLPSAVKMACLADTLCLALVRTVTLLCKRPNERPSIFNNGHVA